MALQLAIDQDHRQPGVQDWQSENTDERVNEVDPGKERKATHRPSWTAQRNNCRDGGNGEAKGTDTQDEESYCPISNPGRRGIGRFTQGRVGEPADRRSAAG